MGDEHPDLNKILQDAISKHMEHLECGLAVLLERYMAETGLKIEQICIIQEYPHFSQDTPKFKMYFAPKVDP